LTQPTTNGTALTSGNISSFHPALVSIHGGHSGQFCNHARDTLEAVVLTYIGKGFEWVGITEHMPPVSDQFLYPDEKAAGLSAADLYHRFAEYIQTGRHLQYKYADQIELFIGMETEAYTGSNAFVDQLKEKFKPDYLVGSLHHVNDHPFDLNPEGYAHAAEALGGLDRLYERYFDQQYAMLLNQNPQVVGHFDIIRIYDPDYRSRIAAPAIKAKILRNLKQIKTMGAILDFNVSALTKGADEPYVTPSILQNAKSLEITVVPGDDSHGVATAGANVDKGIEILEQSGFNLNWVKPVQ
jgi:histidinol-phosphatase (PHP family)